MTCVDYIYYASEYMGTAIPEEAFPALSKRAAAYVDYITMGRAENAAGDAENAVKSAVCAIAEAMQDGDKLSAISSDTSRPISSETVGGWSRSFGSKAVSSSDMQLLETRKREIAMMYLAPYGLLRARGFGPCPCSPTP